MVTLHSQYKIVIFLINYLRFCWKLNFVFICNLLQWNLDLKKPVYKEVLSLANDAMHFSP